MKVIYEDIYRTKTELELTEYSFLWLIVSCVNYPLRQSLSLNIEYKTISDGKILFTKLSGDQRESLILTDDIINYLGSQFTQILKILNYLDNYKDFNDAQMKDFWRFIQQK